MDTIRSNRVAEIASSSRHLGAFITMQRICMSSATDPPDFGSLPALYDGADGLDAQFTSAFCRGMLTSTFSSSEFERHKLKLNIDKSPWVVDRDLDPLLVYHSGGAFTRGGASFVIGDDLRMAPLTGSLVQTLADHGITDPKGLEFRDMTFGLDEIVAILIESLASNAWILTTLILKIEQNVSAAPKPNPRSVVISQYRVDQEGITSSSKKMNLRVTLLKSTKKLLFAQAEDDFINFLLSFLTIPLGEVVRLLDNDTGFKSIDNLHRSLTKFTNFRKYLKTPDTMDRLTKPKLPLGYLSENHILPLSEEECLPYSPCLSDAHKTLLHNASLVRGNYVRGLQVYMVTDDLTVTPYCITTAIDILNRMEVPLSDVEEVELHIGLAEALSLLKASLTSVHALTDGLLSIPSH